MSIAGTAKQAAKKPVQKVKQAVGQGSKLKDALTEDTGSTLGAAAVLGLAVIVAGAAVLGSEAPLSSLHCPSCQAALTSGGRGVRAELSGGDGAAAPKPAAKPALPAPRELVPKPAKAAVGALQQSVKQAAKAAPSPAPAPAPLPKPAPPPAPITPPAPPLVIPEKPQVQCTLSNFPGMIIATFRWWTPMQNRMEAYSLS